MKEFSCAALVPHCEESFQGESDDDILRQVAEHARVEHGLDEVPPEVEDKILASIFER